MRTIIVAETPGKYISFLFEELKRNKRELKIACWNSEGKINIILQNFKTLKFIFLTLHKADFCLKDLDKDKYKLILLK
jgi:hypothetical protein